MNFANGRRKLAVGAGVVAVAITLAATLIMKQDVWGRFQKEFGYEKRISVSFCRENGSCVEVLRDSYGGTVRKGTLERVIFGMRKADRDAVCKMLATKKGEFYDYNVLVEQDMNVNELASETPSGIAPKHVGNVKRLDSYGAQEFCSQSRREMDFEPGLPEAYNGKKTRI